MDGFRYSRSRGIGCTEDACASCISASGNRRTTARTRRPHGQSRNPHEVGVRGEERRGEEGERSAKVRRAHNNLTGWCKTTAKVPPRAHSELTGHLMLKSQSFRTSFHVIMVVENVVGVPLKVAERCHYTRVFAQVSRESQPPACWLASPDTIPRGKYPLVC